MKSPKKDLIFLAKGATELGDWIATVAAPTLLYSLAGDAGATAFLIVCRLAPYLVANVVVGQTSRLGVSPNFIIRWSSLARTFIIPLFLLASSTNHYYLLTLCVYGLGAIASPCYFSIIRESAQEERDLSRSNNYLLALQNGMMVLGPIIGAFLQVILGFRFLFVLSATLNLCTFVLSFWLPVPSSTEADRKSTHGTLRIKTLFKSSPFMSKLIFVDAVSGLAFGSLNAIIPMVCQMRFDNSALLYSTQLAFLTGGMLFGNMVFHVFFRKQKMSALYIRVTLVALLSYVGYCSIGSPLVGMLFLALTGIGNSMQDVALITTIQKDAPGNSAAFVISLRDSLGATTALLSTALLTFVSTDESVLVLGFTLWLISTFVCLGAWIFNREDIL